jgi:6-pyruvoyltetrahydropterin/6-carboxytetrahydropterin synthase
MKIGKTYYFEAAHSLPGHNGKCRNLHGHSYRLDVELEGIPILYLHCSDDGMILDFDDLDRAVERIIDGHLDHRNLNASLPESEVRRTTAELICGWVSRRIDQELAAVRTGRDFRLSRVRLWETVKSWAEWTP